MAFFSTTWAAPDAQTVPTVSASSTPTIKVIVGHTETPGGGGGGDTPTPINGTAIPTATAKATAAPPPSGPFTGVCCLPGIAFDSNRDGNKEIYLMRADGTSVTRLTDNAAMDVHPAGSPNALFIVFESNRDDPDPLHCGTAGFPNCILHLYQMNVDGSNLARLTDGPFADEGAAWSFDNSRIAFDSTRADPDPLHCGQTGHPNCVKHIFVMNPDGSHITDLTPFGPLTPTPPSTVAAVANFHPMWSPDDARLAFVSNRNDPHPDTCDQSGQPACVTEIYVMQYDGTQVTRLTSDSVQNGHAAWSADASSIVFHSNRTGRYQIYSMKADGTQVKQLTNDTGDDVDPIWAPGCNNRIVFASNRDGGQYRIWSMNDDGSDQSRLTTLPSGSPADDENPAWSGLPEALRIPPGPCCVPGIAFQSSRTGDSEIYLLKSDGSFLTQITFNSAADMHPAPSFNGQQIAFESNRDDHNFLTCGQAGNLNCIFHIFTMRVDGSNIHQTTSGAWADTSPAWSLDGTHIAFESTRDDPDPLHCGLAGQPACIVNVYVMRADGSEVTRLTQSSAAHPLANTHPNWAPDNQQLVFVSNRDGNQEIYKMNADGTGQTRLTNNPAQDSHPSWSTDGKVIAFESNRDGRFQIYEMGPDGSNQTRMTNDQGNDRHPNWCPSCTNRLVFASNRDGVTYNIYTMNSDGTSQVRLTIQLPGSTAPDDMPAWSGLPVVLPVPIALPPLLGGFVVTPALVPTSRATTVAAAPVTPVPSATATPTTAAALPPTDFSSTYFVNVIHTPLDLLKAPPETLVTNGAMAILLALLFGFFGLLLYDTFEAHEKELQGLFGPLNRFLAGTEVGRERLSQFLAVRGLTWLGDLLEIVLALLIFGLVYSLLNPQFSLGNPDILPLILGMALSVGLVNLMDDIAKLTYLRRVGARATVRVHNANFFIAGALVLISRVAALQPGILAVGPGGLEGEEKGDPFTLNLLGVLGYAVPALIAWLLLIPFALQQAQGTSLWLATVLSLIFAIGLQTAFFEMVPIPGLYGNVIYHRNRLVWFLLIAFFAFLFAQTQLNPDGQFLGAFNKPNVVWLTIFTLAFCLFSAGVWFYFQRRKPPTVGGAPTRAE